MVLNPNTESDVSPCAPFERMAEAYDGWFETERGKAIFQLEIDCIRDLLEETTRPWLEVGVGTGRFASALHLDVGVDSSPAVLRIAEQRGVSGKLGDAEALPCSNEQFGVVFLLMTLCFLKNPLRALQECHRVLRKDGHVIVGCVPRNSSWGEHYVRKGAAGDSFYSQATFYTPHQVIDLAAHAGLFFCRAVSGLVERPEQTVESYACPKDGIIGNAGFVAMLLGSEHEDWVCCNC